MNPWLDQVLRSALALVLLYATAKAVLARRSGAPTRAARPARPTGQGPRALERLLAAAATSAYSRERVQERLQRLAADLEALEGGPACSGPDAEGLAAYLAEDHVGFKGGGRPKPAADFLPRTEAALRLLERRRPHSQGGLP